MTTQESKTILLVEDEAIIAIAEARAIRQFGYDVVTAGSGEKAIALAIADNTVDLILMDIDLGKGMNGPGAALQILKKRSLPIMFLTSHSEREMVEKVRGITRYGYVIKNSGDFVLQSSIEMAFELFDAHRDVESKMEALRESEEQFRNLWGTTVEGIAILDRGLVVEVNDAMCRTFGYMREQVIGKSLLDFAPAEMRGRIRERIESGDTERFETSAVRADGAEIILEVFAKQIFYHGKPMRMAATRDITERKRAEEARRESEEKFRSLVETTMEWIWEMDMNGRHTYSNRGVTPILGFNPEEFVGQNAVPLLHAEDQAEVERTMMGLMAEKRGWRGWVLRWRHKDGSYRFLESNAEPILGPNGEMRGYRGTDRDITERKRTEEVLRENEERMRAIVEGTPHLFFYTQDAEANTTYVSPTVEHITGHKVDAWLKKRDWFITHSAVNEGAMEKTRAHLRGEFTGDPIVVEVRHANGQPILLEAYEYPITKDGAIVGLRGVAYDITKQKRAEKTLQESEDRFRSLYENSTIGIYRTTPDGTIILANPTLVKMLGYSSFEELSARNLDHDGFEPSYERKQFIAQIEREGEVKGLESAWIRRDRSTAYMRESARAFRDADGRSLYYDGTVEDITDRKEVEEALRESEERYRRLSDDMPGYVSVFLPDGTLTYANHAAAALTGLDASQLVGLNFFSMLTLEDAAMIRKQLGALSPESPTENHEQTFMTSDGTAHWQQWTNRAFFDKNGSVTHYHATGIDVTERKRAEENVQNLLREKELLLHEVHHRVKNNMTIVMSLLTMQASAQKEASATNALRDASNRMRSMLVLYDLLYRSENFGQASTTSFLSHLLDQIINTFPNRNLIAVEKHIDDFLLDIGKLSPVGIIVNELMTNCMKYAFEDRDNGLIRVSASMKDGRVHMSVEDNGVGLPELIDIKTSTGLGMQLVEMLATQLEGTIRIERGEGTKFILEFAV